MSIQTLVDDVKTRVQDLNVRRQKVAKVSLDSLKQANQIVVDHSQGLYRNQKAASRELLESAKSGFSKARADGLKAVLSAPTSYLPPRAKLGSVLNDTREAFTGARDELIKVARTGYTAATTETAARKVKTVARKTTRATKKAATKTSRATKAAVAEIKA